MLVEARERLGLPREIHAMLMVCDYNYQRIDEAYDLVLRQIGADKLKLNFLLPTLFQFSKRRDAFWDLHSRNIDVEVLMRKIEECEAEYDLDFNPRWKTNVRDYAETLERHHRGGTLQTSGRLCDSPDRNMIIELQGGMRLCSYPKFPSSPYRERGDLARYWYSPETEAVRAEMRECRDVCGMCHAYRREPSSRASAERKLGRLEPRDAPRHDRKSPSTTLGSLNTGSRSTSSSFPCRGWEGRCTALSWYSRSVKTGWRFRVEDGKTASQFRRPAKNTWLAEYPDATSTNSTISPKLLSCTTKFNCSLTPGRVDRKSRFSRS